MKLHWSPRSPFVRKVMIAAHEMGLTDRIETVRTVVAMSKPHAGLMADNPLSKIPTLVLDDGTVLYDSLVIIEYLDGLHQGPKMIPTGPGRLTTLRRHALCTGLLDLLVLFRNERDRPDGARSEPHLAAFRIKAEGAVKALEAELPEIAKTPFDVAQVTLGCCLDYLAFRFAADDWWQGLPNLGAWHETFKARPSVKAFPIVDA